MTTWVTVCDTCKRSDNEQTPLSGARLAALVEAAAEGESQVRVRRHGCLMGCARACNVTVQGPGKLGYTLAEFTPEPAVAEALVRWAAMHAESATGQVPYRDWPEAVKGHFVSRHLPLPEPK